LRLERTAPIILTVEEELEISELQQAIKIAETKRQIEKITKYMQRVNLIKTGGARKKRPDSMPCSVPDSGYSSDIEDKSESGIAPEKRGIIVKGVNTYLTQKNRTTVYVNAGEVVSILATLKTKWKRGERTRVGNEKLSGCLLVHEVKNVESMKRIQWEATVCQDHLSYMNLRLSAPHLFSKGRSQGLDGFSDTGLLSMPLPPLLEVPVPAEPRGEELTNKAFLPVINVPTFLSTLRLPQSLEELKIAGLQTPPNSPRDPKDVDEMEEVEKNIELILKDTKVRILDHLLCLLIYIRSDVGNNTSANCPRGCEIT